MKKVMALLLTFAMIVSLAACGSSKNEDSSKTHRENSVSDKGSDNAKNNKDNSKGNNKAVEDSKEAEEEPEESVSSDEEVEYVEADWTEINDTIEFTDALFTIHYVIKDEDENYVPEEGMTYFLVHMTIDNLSDEELTTSTLDMYQLEDSEKNVYDVSLSGLALLSEYDTLDQADGTIPAGDSFECGVAFEIPKEAKGLKLFIKDFNTDDYGHLSVDID